MPVESLVPNMGLTELMRRVNSRLDPEDFIETVSCAFQDVRGGSTSVETRKRFVAEPSYALFRKALSLANERGRQGQSVLVLGCGRGFAGEGAEFAADSVREAFDSRRPPVITACNLTPAAIRDASRGVPTGLLFDGKESTYDLVVTHSLFHYIPDVLPVFVLIRKLIKASGGLIVGHEPNANFWKNAECQASLAGMQRARRVQRWCRSLDPRRHIFRSRTVQPQPESMMSQVNRRLQEHYGFTGPLTVNEILRLVDVHRPEAVRGTFRIGHDGFDLDEWTQTMLVGFGLVWAGSTGQLGYISSSSLSQKWKRKEAELAARHPLAGSVFSAFWSRSAL